MKLNESIQSICVFRALQLGDMLCSVPAFRALRMQFPQARISLVGLPWAKWLVKQFPHYFDVFIEFSGYPGLPEKPYDPRAVLNFLSEMQDRKFDLVLQMQGNGTIVNPMISLFGGGISAGFYPGNYYRPNEEYFLEYPVGIHEIDRHLALMSHLGIPLQGRHLEFPVTFDDEQQLAELDLPIRHRKYVCVHPGSRGSWRQWPIEHFAALGDYAASLGMDVVITGTAEELPITTAVAAAMKSSSINLTGKTTLGSIGVLIRHAFALVSNCTGVSHIASAMNTPGIIISMDGEPERWGPINAEILKTIDWTKNPDFDQVLNTTRRLFVDLDELRK